MKNYSILKLGLPNRLELYLLITTLSIYAFLSLLNILNQQDTNYIYYSIVVFCVVLILNYLASSIVNLIPYIPREICSIYFFGLAIAMAGGMSIVLPILAALLLAYWSWYLFTRRRSNLVGVKLMALCATIISFGYIAAYPALEVINRSHNEAHASPSADNAGPLYSVRTFSYGSGEDKHREEFSSGTSLPTKTVDVSDILPNWDGFSGWYRTLYWGFDNTALPLNARVWMPDGEGPFPLVLINHGDHAMQDYSDTGYEYLAKPLAEKGYIVASIDNNFLNRSWSDLMLTQSLTGAGEIKTRAQLTVEHIKVWENWNNNPQHRYFKKVDLGRVTVIGHSRGGEAVAHVPHLLATDGNEGIKVKSVVAIAPVDGYYWPNGELNILENTNYMVLHGSLDGEMHFAGIGQYSRTNVAEGQDLTKVAIYIEGANHGQFNSTWGRCDNEFSSPLCTRWNLKHLISEESQKEIARSTISAFLDLTIKGEEAYKDYFSDKKELSELNLGTPHKVQYQDSSSTVLRDFQGSDASDSIRSNSLAISSMRHLQGSAVSHHMQWRDCANEEANKSCWVEYSLPSTHDLETSTLRLDLANGSEFETNFTIKVKFIDGSEMVSSIEELGLLEGAYARSLRKFDYFLGNRSSEVAFDTYFFDLEKSSVPQSLTLIFDKKESGEIYVDNIGFL